MLIDRPSRFQHLLSLREAVLVVEGRLGRLLGWTLQAARLLGRPDHEPPADDLVDLFAFEPAQHVVAALAAALEGTEPEALLRWRARDAQGEPRLLELSLSPLPCEPGEAPAVAVMLRQADGPFLREGRTLEDAPVASELPFRQLVEHTFESLGIHVDGEIVVANRATERLFGYEPGELVGQDVFTLFVPEQRELLQEQARRDVAASFEVGGVRKDGSRFDVEMVVGPVMYQGRKARMGAIRDISERKRLERELAAQNERLRELDALKSHFINTVAHELRTPLVSVLGYAELLDDGIAGELTPQQGALLDELQRGAQRLNRLVDDLLDSAQLEAGVYRFQFQEDDVRQLLLQAAASLEPALARAGIALEIDMPDEPLVVPFDAARLEQVLGNLLGNALKFTPAGGRIRLCAVPTAEGALLSVCDTGSGIAPEELPHVFDRYYQVAPWSQARRRGVGLGLSIAKAIVDGHGGDIGVESSPGEGAHFWLTLPRRRAAKAPACAG